LQQYSRQHHLVYETFWQGTDSAPHARLGGVAVYRERGSSALRATRKRGHSVLTLGVLPLGPERKRLEEAGLEPGPMADAQDFFIMRMRDPDGNLIVFASAEKD
jgi:hypothetical protein